jgi:beta-glucosidase
MNAGPLAVGWAQDRLPAIMAGWYPGEFGGTAIARALFGDDNPGGHLPYTVYANLDGVPQQNEYDVSKGYTYLYFKGVPLYPFGHGLSYTRFEYKNLKVSSASVTSKGKEEISFDLKNVGQVAGAEVAQLYTHQNHSGVVQPIKTLRAFQRVMLQPGETRRVTFSLPASQLAYYDIKTKAFQVEPGTFQLLIGSSSEDIRVRTQFAIANAVK